MDKPFFSIVIPVYNAGQWLEPCLASVFAQDCTDYELVLVDDGSTDGSGALCDTIAAGHGERVRVIHQSNQGIFRAKYAGYAAARGEYMVSSDQDDLMAPDLLSSIAAVIDAHSADLVIFNFSYIDMDGHAYGAAPSHVFQEGAVDRGEWLVSYLIGDATPGLWSRVFRKELYDFDFLAQHEMTDLDEDFPQSLRIGIRAKSIYYLDRALYFWRINPASVSRTPDAAVSCRALSLDIPIMRDAIRDASVHVSAGRLDAAAGRYSLNSIWKAVCRVIRSGDTKAERKKALKEMLSSEAVRDSRKYLGLPDPLRYRALGLKLFYGGHFSCVEALCRAISLARHILRR